MSDSLASSTKAEASRAVAALTSRLDVTAVAPVGLVLGAVLLLGATNGGYFPSSWGWSALAFSWVALIALLVRDRIFVARAEIRFVGTMALFLAWIALTLIWTPSVTLTMHEVERMLCYLTFAVALVLVLRNRHVTVVLGAVLVSATVLAGYALATRLLPGRIADYGGISGYRLTGSLGYWNALSLLCALGSVLALGLVARGSKPVARALAASSLVVLVPTLYFTFGRGGWVALFAGLAVIVAIDPRRLQFLAFALAVAPWPALALWWSYDARSLKSDVVTASVTADGKRLAWTIAVLAVVAFAATMGVLVLESRFKPTVWVRRAFAAALAAAALVVVVGGLAAAGGPNAAVTKVRDSIRQASPDATGDHSRRLFSLSSNGRIDLWRAAIDEGRAYPVLGYGAGAFERWWLQHRTFGTARDAHSLYLETFGDLGVVGLGILLVMLGIPCVVAIRRRGDPVVPVAAGALAAYLVHAGIDWDWEMPVLTISALTFAGCILVGRRRNGPVYRIYAERRTTAIWLVAAAMICAFVVTTGNRALAQAQAAADRGDPAAAFRHARSAARWVPWSSEPLQLEADARLAQSRRLVARRLYREALAKDAQNWELWLGLALASEGAVREEALGHVRQLNPQALQLQDLTKG